MGDAVGGGFGEALDETRVPLHHPADGPPPRDGEEFVPVPTRQRDDGWSPARQRRFGLVRRWLGGRSWISPKGLQPQCNGCHRNCTAQ